ncbi:MASE2 domain-containing protein [Pseudomonas citronellolis]|uniref:MASE2 domain-containing protein n=1 Tax=Pseudomonas citronellolis TaxID=53408 RepID=UPI0023E4348E|nr:MASE2 domain-containing protein [Pseudomonas citronellolis]MDF3933427.1 MASE2 domain-containing protein [Pseudomonas citronellolis]
MEMESSLSAGIGFARRIHAPRSLGCGLSFIFIAVLIYPGSPGVWAWMLVNGFVWPSVARVIAVRAREPYRAELRNLLLDSLFAGGWLAVMHFSLLPSALLLSMVTMHNAAANGPAFMLKGLLANLAGVALMGLLIGFKVELDTPSRVIWACLPMLFLYPLAVGWTSYSLARRLHAQRRAFALVNCLDERQLLPSDAWLHQLAEEFGRCRRGGPRASLALIRIDDHAALRRRYGGLTAEALSLRLGHLIKAEVRNTDHVCRRQPDEFLVLFRHTHGSGVRACIERIEQLFGDHDEALLSGLSLSYAVVDYASAFAGEHDWLEQARRELDGAAAPLAASH